MGRKKNIDTFGCPVEEDIDTISGFSDEPVIKGKCLSSFSFDDSNINEEVNQLQNHNHEKVISKEISFTDSTDDPQNLDTDNDSNIITTPTNTEIITDSSKENTTTALKSKNISSK